MNTFELLVVFAALMVVVALVAIAVDWVGRPLRNRRFIPRIYRYEDELDPGLAAGQFPNPQHQLAPSVPVHAPRPVPAPATRGEAGRAEPPSAFSQAATAAEPDPFHAAGDQVSTRSLVAETVPVASADEWHPGMALDARTDDHAPTVAVKAERYWKETAALLDADSHFTGDAHQLMAQGKPPRRHNPRTGDIEAPELVGLRAASSRADVRMRWPETAVDPWNAR